jgi:hypothetical protein
MKRVNAQSSTDIDQLEAVSPLIISMLQRSQLLNLPVTGRELMQKALKLAMKGPA